MELEKRLREAAVNKLRVGVLMGGKSQEREVSFNSGRTVCDYLDSTRYEIIPIFQTKRGSLYLLPWNFMHRGKTNDFEHRLDAQAKKISWSVLKQYVDFIYIAMHGRYAEDGTLQGMLDLLHIPYLGSKIFASALCMNKIMANNILHAHKISVPQSIVIMPSEINNFDQHKNSIIKKVESASLKLPFIIKPHNEGSSLGVSAIFNINDLQNALLIASNVHPETPQAVLIEEKIEGMEFSCIVLTDYKTGKPILLPPTEIIPEAGTHVHDYEQKYMPGRALEFTPARCSSKEIALIQGVCVKVMTILNMKNFARIDGFLTKEDEVVIVDANSITGMGPASFFFREAAEVGMSQARLINHLIETELYSDLRLAKFLVTDNSKAVDNMNERIKIAVLFGGQSNEKEISLESGRNVVYKLSPDKYSVTPIFISSAMEPHVINDRLLLRHSTREIEYELTQSMKISWDDLLLYADFVFIALHGGAGENGTIQGALEMLGLPYNGSGVLSSALCMDKYKTALYLKENGFDVPSSFLVDHNEWKEQKEKILKKIIKEFKFPFIVKPHDDGCSVLVHKVCNEQELVGALDNLFTSGKIFALVEEFITGMELTVGVIGNENPRALPPSQSVAKNEILSIQEKFLPGAGENQTPAPLNKSALDFVKKTMEEVFVCVGCRGYVRIDCFYQNKEQSPTGKERVIILEINSLPALTPATCLFHQAAEIGIKPMEFIDLIVQFSINANKNIFVDLPLGKVSLMLE